MRWSYRWEIGIVRPQLRRVVDEYRNMLYIEHCGFLPGLIFGATVTRKICRPIDLARSRILSGVFTARGGQRQRYREINDIEVGIPSCIFEKGPAGLVD